ncbi:MAG: class I SAM-dependent methyltransferase [Bacteroidetes bacterium]|nr:class I SAM-dependent methyltransferase [Bacteroidota bacterium]
MFKDHLKYLVCPKCRTKLFKSEFEIVRHIPRFVSSDNYAGGFGLEWNKHARTQYDSYSGSNVSEKRFFEETKWPKELPGEIILEVGSGSGRFTEHAASTRAMVISLDYSYAVDANFASNGAKSNVLIVQADIYNMPFQYGSFDKLFCFGVLQHTPLPGKSFMELPQYLKTGGSLVIDVYVKKHFSRQLLNSKYWIRPFTKRLNPEILYDITSKYVNFMWPLARLFNKLSYGRNLNWFLMIADYGGKFTLPDNILREWAILDTFDMLSPAYDYPQTLETVNQWFHDAHMTFVEVHYGYNGIEARGRK